MRLNSRRRPILCTTLYRNLMQVSNFGGTFDQLFLWIFLWNFHRRCLSTLSIPWCKSQKWPKNQIKGGGGPALISLFSVSGKVQKLRVRAEKTNKGHSKKKKKTCGARHIYRYTRTPAKHVHGSILRDSLKQAHQKGCWQTGAPTTPPSNPRFRSFPPESRWDRRRAAPAAVTSVCHAGMVGPFPFLSVWEWQRLVKRCAALPLQACPPGKGMVKVT